MRQPLTHAASRTRRIAHVNRIWMCLTVAIAACGSSLNDVDWQDQLKHAHVRRHADHGLDQQHHPNSPGHAYKKNLNAVPLSCSLFSVVNGSMDTYRMYHCPDDNLFLIHTSRPRHTPSFLVRVIGPHTLTTQLSRRRDDHTHAVAYATPHAGAYHAFIRVLMEHVSHENVTDACLSTLPTVQHAFERVMRGGDNILDEVVPDAMDEKGGAVSTHVAPPAHYWQSDADLAIRLPHLFNVSNNQASMQHDYNDLHLHHPALLPLDAVARCMATPATICLYGDSQTRHLTASMQSFADTHSLTNVTLSYSVLRFPGNLTSALAQTAGRACTHSLFNFGHWPLGWVEYRPWTVTEWRRELDTFLGVVAGAVEAGAVAGAVEAGAVAGAVEVGAVAGAVEAGAVAGAVEAGAESAVANATSTVVDRTARHQPLSTLHWVSLPPFPTTHPRVTACPPVDWRLLPNIDTFNRVARQLVDAKHPHVHYVNTFDAMLHMHDFTYDGSHYLEPVGPAVAHLVFSQLCNRL